MDFAQAATNKAKFTRTENGAVALNTTGNKCLDLFSTIGALREAEDVRVCRLFADAFNEDALLATKIAFYGRDVRGGLGERKTFRTILKYMAMFHPEAVTPNLDLIGVYGRYDDLYCLVDTPVEKQMWAAMKKQFEEDLQNLQNGNAVSLLAKWIKSPDTSSKESCKLGVQTWKHISGDTLPVYKKKLHALRKQIGIVESLMSADQWDQIKYPDVPSRAMMIYRSAFMKHDTDRYKAFIQKAVNGEETINSATLFPYDIVEKLWRSAYRDDDATLEAQWRQLPNYVEPGTNAIVMADTSGSMCGRPMCTAIGLAIYFAERNTGAYHNLWMSFSADPEIQQIKGETLLEKFASMDMHKWGMNTNLEAAFYNVLDIAIENNVAPEDMPKSIVVISDMEIDYCGDKDWSFYDKMKAEFCRAGYEIPNIIFWNVNSRHDVFHADATRKGVQLVGGQSTAIFKQVMSCVGMTPTEAMFKIINSEGYEPIKVLEK